MNDYTFLMNQIITEHSGTKARELPDHQLIGFIAADAEFGSQGFHDIFLRKSAFCDEFSSANGGTVSLLIMSSVTLFIGRRIDHDNDFTFDGSCFGT